MLIKYKPNYLYDVHSHTTRSDGMDTPKELIDNAVKIGMKAAAITDHDVNPPKYIEVDNKKINIRDYANQKGINLILGDEFSTDTYVDDVHIVGYELDWEHPSFKAEVKRARNSKSEAYRKLCEVLSEHGMPIDYENEILKYEDENGKKHTRSPDDVERKYIFEKMAEKEYAETWEDAKILVRDNPELNVRRPKIDPLDAIDLIHKCGGIAVLAHPYLIDKEVEPEGLGKMSRLEYIERLINQGLDGIEARYTYDKTSYKGNKTPEEIEKEVRDMYGDRLKISGGSDYHAGHKKGIENPRRLGDAGINSKEFKILFADLIEII